MEDILTKFYSFVGKSEDTNTIINRISQLPKDLFPEAKYVYTRALLENQFSPRKFTISETKDLLDKALPFNSLENEGNELILEWYTRKYF